MKKILVPTDFSHCAEMALRYAVYIAKKTGAQITLIHVCDLLDDNFTKLKHIIREYNRVKRAELARSLTDLKKCVEKEDVLIKTQVYNGKIVDSILMAAQDHRANLIIMGTLGATGLKTVFFGTKAAAVINRSSIPVITIPNEYKKPALNKILLTLDHINHSPKILEPLFKLIKFAHAKLKAGVFTVKNADKVKKKRTQLLAQSIQKELEEKFPGNSIDFVIINGANFHEAVQKYVEIEKTDLLVMLTHQRTFMENLFKFSMTQKMAYHVNIPLMSLNGDNYSDRTFSKRKQ